LTDGGDGASSGISNPFYGKPLLETTRKKLSISHTGQHVGELNIMHNKHHSISAKTKMSIKNRKVDDISVEQIRTLSRTGKYTGKQLSKMFNVSTAQISRIINRKQRNL
jgi:hypothetical protein